MIAVKGSCLLTGMTQEQVRELEARTAVLTELGWECHGGVDLLKEATGLLIVDETMKEVKLPRKPD